MVDLWPSDINVDQIVVKSPVHVLREQASLLGRKTKNIVNARITSYERPTWYNPIGIAVSSLVSSPPTEPLDQKAKNFEYSFELIAPVLDNYSYLMFVVSFDINNYPLTVSLAKELREELTIEPKANNETEFLEILRQIFGATKTRNIIQALISQSVSYNRNTND